MVILQENIESMLSFAKELSNFKEVQANICNIIKRYNLQQDVKLILVSKTFSADKIQILNSAGQIDFAENYIQELEGKNQQLGLTNIVWHFIGNIQSNKIKKIAQYASWVHSLENAQHAVNFNKSRNAKLAPLNVLIEVNISGDKNKHGVKTFAEVLAIAKIINALPRLRLRGLMGVATNIHKNNLRDKQFAQLKIFFDKLIKSGYNIDTLSMGMSQDYKIAIKNGATMLRLGSAVFGKRE